MELFAIGGDLEGATARRDERERRDSVAEFENFSRQTDGFRCVVSNRAVFDSDFGFHRLLSVGIVGEIYGWCQSAVCRRFPVGNVGFRFIFVGDVNTRVSHRETATGPDALAGGNFRRPLLLLGEDSSQRLEAALVFGVEAGEPRAVEIEHA